MIKKDTLDGEKKSHKANNVGPQFRRFRNAVKRFAAPF